MVRLPDQKEDRKNLQLMGPGPINWVDRFWGVGII